VNAKTGVLQWKTATGVVVHASAAITNNTVYIGSWDSYLYALDAETGQEKWKFKAGEDPIIHNQQGFESSPAVADRIVYVGCRDGHLYAIDAATGRKKWDYPTNRSPAISLLRRVQRQAPRRRCEERCAGVGIPDRSVEILTPREPPRCAIAALQYAALQYNAPQS
jgi:glucose dehydrogenase